MEVVAAQFLAHSQKTLAFNSFLVAFNVFSSRTASGEKQNSHKTDGSCFNHQSALQQNSGALHPLEKLCMCSPFLKNTVTKCFKM